MSHGNVTETLHHVRLQGLALDTANRLSLPEKLALLRNSKCIQSKLKGMIISPRITKAVSGLNTKLRVSQGG